MSTDLTGTEATKAQLESEIQELRLELGETVEALTQRLDVKARVQEKARRIPVAPVAALAVAVLALVVWKKRS